MNINKGKQVTVSTVFKQKGIAVTLLQPPVWTVRNSSDKVLHKGIAVPDGTRWNAIFTVSTNYVVPSGEETLMVEFNAITTNGREFTVTKEVQLIDVEDAYKPIGLLYSQITQSPLVDSFYAASPDVESIDYSIFTPYQTLIKTFDTIDASAIVPQLTSRGYEYKVNLGRPDIPEFFTYNEPMIGVLSYTIADGSSDEEVHPIYGVNARVASLSNQLKQYLDKAQLVEIDPSLQWYLVEYVHFLQEGIKHINSTGTTLTYWTVMTCPSNLHQYLFAAAALYALNARYLAEGMNSFQFSGLTTNLDYDRKEAITYKIDELKVILDQGLDKMKNAVVGAGISIGLPPSDSGETPVVPRIGIMGLRAGPMNGKLPRQPLNNRFRSF